MTECKHCGSGTVDGAINQNGFCRHCGHSHDVVAPIHGESGILFPIVDLFTGDVVKTVRAGSVWRHPTNQKYRVVGRGLGDSPRTGERAGHIVMKNVDTDEECLWSAASFGHDVLCVDA